MNDLVLFMAAWLKSPAATGAIMPSSAALASAITQEITSVTGPVLELGSGTGAFTRKLVQNGVAVSDLTLVECNQDFADRLQVMFHDARILRMDARLLDSESLYTPTAGAGAVVCGLPLLAMPRADVAQILHGAFRQLRPDGAFYLFTYGPLCPVRKATLERNGLYARRLCTVLANVPPANVYKITRARADA